jgi:hypothetical protein
MTSTLVSLNEPLDGVTAARLQVIGGTPEGLRVLSAARKDLLAEGSFAHPGTQVTRDGGALSIRTRHGLRNRRENWLALGTGPRWDISVRGGVADASLDFSDLNLVSLDIIGGIARAELALGQVMVPLRLLISDGAESLRIVRPAGIPARVVIKGGVERLELDGQQWGEGTASVKWHSAGFTEDAPGLSIEISGGVEAFLLSHS